MLTTWIVIVNWNGKENTLECLRSIATMSQKATMVVALVVDNNSSDDSVEAIRKLYPDVKVLEAGHNLGFTGGNNKGISYALEQKADYIWLLNNDTVVDKTSLDMLIPSVQDKNIGIASPKIYFYPGNEFHFERYKEKDRGRVIWYAGGLIDWKNVYASHKGVDEVDMGQYDNIEDTEFISGCAMLIKANVIKKIGLLDEKYFLYLEDLDYSIRVKTLGFRLLYVGNSWIWHKNAGSTSKPGNKLHEYYMTRNRLLFGLRYAPTRAKIALLRQGFSYVIHGGDVRRKAVLDALTGKFGDGFVWKK